MAAAALQFPLAHPAIASVIPGIGNVRRIDQTLNLFATDIPHEFWSALSERGLIRDDAPTPAGSSGE
jgi:D-threo-aldose 1-dehydrogenase